MTTNSSNENGADAVAPAVDASENHPPSKQEQISMIDDISAEANAATEKLNCEVRTIFPVSHDCIRTWFDVLEKLRGPGYHFDSNGVEGAVYRMNHFPDSERRHSEFWNCVHEAYESNRIPSGFEFEWEPGLFVLYQPIQEFPKILGLGDIGNVEVSTSEQVFSDGTTRRIVGIEASNAELTYESVHTLIDQLKDAARSLVVAEGQGWQ